MEKEIPKIEFTHKNDLGIEVMSFDQLRESLNSSKNHNPYNVHKIQFYLILVVTESKYTHFIDFESFELRKEDAIFIAKNQVHHFTTEIEKAKGFAVIFNYAFADKFHFLSNILKLNRLFNYHIESPVIRQSEFGNNSFINILNQLFFEYSLSSEFAKSEILGSLLNVLLLKAERAKEFHAITKVNKYWLETFSKFSTLLEKKYMDTRSSRDYALKLNISYKLLNDIVKKMTGETVKSFIDEFVIKEIKRYLVSSSQSVKEISYQAGFDDPANMIKFFKKHTSITPLKFRQL